MDILEFIKEIKGKRDKTFLELFYNKNFYVETKNLHYINSAYKFQDELNLNISRKDYSNIYIIRRKGA